MGFPTKTSFRLTTKVKEMFFDRQAVRNFIGEKSAAVLNRYGSRVQKRAAHSMRTRGHARKVPKNLTGKAYAKWLMEARDTPASPPGKPPFVHSGNPNASLRKILYALEPDRMTVLIGPVLLNGSKNTSPTVPELHEFGGKARRRQKRVGNQWVPMGRRARPGQPTRTAMVDYPKRSFMGPANEIEAPKLPSLWATTKPGRNYK